MSREKNYGLLGGKKHQLSLPKATNVFGEEDDEDEDNGTDWVRKALKAEGEKHKMKKQTKLDMQKALNEDPTIYQYDEVYDDMEQSKSKEKISKKIQDKPKYITNLLKAAERRKKEQEYRLERDVQKQREAEGDEFADKESFVTSGYRAKLEEFKLMEEEEARMSRLESIGDVTLQKDMSGFYRHLFEQTVEKAPGEDGTGKKGGRQYRRRVGDGYESDEVELEKKQVVEVAAEAKKLVEPEQVKCQVVAREVEDVPDEISGELEVEKMEEPTVSIWEKRTVGEVYQAALERYFSRKNLRIVA